MRTILSLCMLLACCLGAYAQQSTAKHTFSIASEQPAFKIVNEQSVFSIASEQCPCSPDCKCEQGSCVNGKCEIAKSDQTSIAISDRRRQAAPVASGSCSDGSCSNGSCSTSAPVSVSYSSSGGCSSGSCSNSPASYSGEAGSCSSGACGSGGRSGFLSRVFRGRGCR